jgi:transcriptional regulator GlxA family with amidase domain
MTRTASPTKTTNHRDVSLLEHPREAAATADPHVVADQRTRVVAFVLFPTFSFLAFASAIEPLRVANLLSGETLYRPILVSQDKQPVQASNGIPITPHYDLNDVPHCDLVVICAGYGGEHIANDTVSGWLRTLARQGVQLAGVGTGTYLLARAGLLDGRRCTVHWENVGSFAEQFRNVDVTDAIFVKDGPYWTSCGGAASMDLMLAIIATHQGAKLSKGIADQFVCSTIRGPDDKQHEAERFGTHHPDLAAVMELMEKNLEEPLTLTVLGRRTNISVRQIQRLFTTLLGKSPGQYYLELRLNRGRALLIQTPMSIAEIAMGSGFSSASHFSDSYKRFFKMSPLQERRAFQATADKGYYIASGMQLRDKH